MSVWAGRCPPLLACRQPVGHRASRASLVVALMLAPLLWAGVSAKCIASNLPRSAPRTHRKEARRWLPDSRPAWAIDAEKAPALSARRWQDSLHGTPGRRPACLLGAGLS